MQSNFKKALEFYKTAEGYTFINGFLLSCVLDYEETFNDLVGFRGDIEQTPEFSLLRGKYRDIDDILERIKNATNDSTSENFIRDLIRIVNNIDKSLDYKGCKYLKENNFDTLYRGLLLDDEIADLFVSGKTHLFHTNFVSTSLNREVSERFAMKPLSDSMVGVLLIIEECSDYLRYHHYQDGEFEIMFQRNTKFVFLEHSSGSSKDYFILSVRIEPMTSEEIQTIGNERELERKAIKRRNAEIYGIGEEVKSAFRNKRMSQTEIIQGKLDNICKHTRGSETMKEVENLMIKYGKSTIEIEIMEYTLLNDGCFSSFQSQSDEV